MAKEVSEEEKETIKNIMKGLSPRQRAKKEGKAYVKIIVDQRYSKVPGGALLEYDGPHSNEQAEEVLKFMLSMIKQKDSK